MPLAKTCPTCLGSGKTSFDAFDQYIPQPTKCPRCMGCGVVSFVDGGRFANGMDIDTFLQERLGPDGA